MKNMVVVQIIFSLTFTLELCISVTLDLYYNLIAYICAYTTWKYMFKKEIGHMTLKLVNYLFSDPSLKNFVRRVSVCALNGSQRNWVCN